jgi:PAS domain S-box-containing protein
MPAEENNAALHEQREWLRVTLSSIGDAVIATDTDGRKTFMNPVAQVVTGWRLEEATGAPLETVFKIVDEQTRRTVKNPAFKALREGVVVGLANHTLLIAKDGTEHPIDDSAAPIRTARRPWGSPPMAWQRQVGGHHHLFGFTCQRAAEACGVSASRRPTNFTHRRR